MTFGPRGWCVLLGVAAEMGFPFDRAIHCRPSVLVFCVHTQVAPRLHDFLHLPATMDARLGVQAVCTRVLPSHTRVLLTNGEASMPQWLMGKSMVILVSVCLFVSFPYSGSDTLSEVACML